MFNFSPLRQKFEKALEHVNKDLAGLRTGKASPQLLDPVSVEAYGTRMRIGEVANVSAPDANMIIVSPWDKSLLEAIAKGISMAQLNLSPVIDGEVIRIVIPPLTEERRKEMVKSLHQKIEAGNIMLRNIRIDAKKDIEDQANETGVSEDDIKADLDELDKILKEFSAKLDEIAKKKETDLMTV